MITTDNGNFQITFNNGYKLSIFNGFGSYSENRYKRDLLEKQIDDNYDCISSENCEIAIIKNGKFVTDSILNSGDSVKGYVDVDELIEIINLVNNLGNE